MGFLIPSRLSANSQQTLRLFIVEYIPHCVHLSNEGLMGFLIHADDDQFLAVRNYTHVFEHTNGKKTMSSQQTQLSTSAKMGE